VVEEAVALARQIAANAPVAVRLARAAWRDADAAALHPGLAGEAARFGACFATADQREGMAAQLARENRTFVFTALKKTARARDYENAIHWLEKAGLILRAFLATKPGQPLSAYADRGAFKVYALDIGLLGAMAGISPDILVRGHDLFQEFKGAFVENHVAQTLAGLPGSGALYYWKNDSATAEVDFLWQSPQGSILPLEAKSGINPKSKSLRIYEKKFHPARLLRTTPLNLRQDGKILNIPLYALTALDRLAS
jgi:predicted AAA+ superfamily ATPase